MYGGIPFNTLSSSKTIEIVPVTAETGEEASRSFVARGTEGLIMKDILEERRLKIAIFKTPDGVSCEAFATSIMRCIYLVMPALTLALIAMYVLFYLYLSPYT